MSKNDRRSKRTEAALLNALAELLKQKQLRKITINELLLEKKIGIEQDSFLFSQVGH